MTCFRDHSKLRLNDCKRLSCFVLDVDTKLFLYVNRNRKQSFTKYFNRSSLTSGRPRRSGMVRDFSVSGATEFGPVQSLTGLFASHRLHYDTLKVPISTFRCAEMDRDTLWCVVQISQFGGSPPRCTPVSLCVRPHPSVHEPSSSEGWGCRCRH